MQDRLLRQRLSRLETLLDSLGVRDRLVNNVEQCDFSKTIDYDQVHKQLDLQRDRSLKILKELVTDENQSII